MKRAFSLLVVFLMLFSLSPFALASTAPPGFKRLSDSDMEKLCSSVNDDKTPYHWEYDKKLGALVITYTETDVADPEKSLCSIVRGAEAGDESASNRLILTEMVFEDYIDSVLGNFYSNGWYADVVLRCIDSLADNTLALEYINGVRTSYRPD